MVDYCIAELRHKASAFQEEGFIIVYEGDVVKSDSAIPESLRLALVAAAAPLEDVQPHRKDWHPGSDEKVLDLVHPSLFPVIYGRTRIIQEDHKLVDLGDCIKRCGEGVTLGVPPADETKLTVPVGSELGNPLNPYSQKFQWLPCDIIFDGDKPM